MTYIWAVHWSQTPDYTPCGLPRTPAAAQQAQRPHITTVATALVAGSLPPCCPQKPGPLKQHQEQFWGVTAPRLHMKSSLARCSLQTASWMALSYIMQDEMIMVPPPPLSLRDTC